MRKRIDVYLNDEEMAFVKWLADRDNLSLSRELVIIFTTELAQLMDLYQDEYREDKEG